MDVNVDYHLIDCVGALFEAFLPEKDRPIWPLKLLIAQRANLAGSASMRMAI